MELTKKQVQALDSLKSQLLRLERKMEDLSIMKDTCAEICDLEKYKELDYMWEECNKQHIELVSFESKSWGVDVYLMLDLIFDRDNTLKLLKNI